MRKKSMRELLCATGLAAALAGSLVGCAGTTPGGYAELPEGAAATVNGTAISEDLVTLKVEGIRSGMGLEDADSWGTWLATNGYTPELVRSQIIDGLVESEVARQGAEAAGFTVSEEELDAYFAYERENVGGEEAWLEYVDPRATPQTSTAL